MKPALYLPLVFLMVACSNSLSTESNLPGTVAIHFSLPEDTHVKLWIENSYHTDVKTLVNKSMLQGNHSVAWDAKDNKGDPVPSGLYIFHLKTENKLFSRTILLDREYNPLK